MANDRMEWAAGQHVAACHRRVRDYHRRGYTLPIVVHRRRNPVADGQRITAGIKTALDYIVYFQMDWDLAIRAAARGAGIKEKRLRRYLNRFLAHPCDDGTVVGPLAAFDAAHGLRRPIADPTGTDNIVRLHSRVPGPAASPA